MTPDDFLENATRAMRADSMRAARSSTASRAAIVHRIVTRQRQRRALAMSAMALVGLLGASTAWAAATGHLSYRGIVERIRHGEVREHSERPMSPRNVTRARCTTQATPEAHVTTTTPSQIRVVNAPAAAREEPIVPVAPVLASNERMPPAAARSGMLRVEHAAHASVAVAVPALEPPQRPDALPATPARPTDRVTANRDAATDAAEALFREAQHADFYDHDSSRALAGWDAYLSAAPHGVLVLEARYNRALDLVRLHRNAEATDALAPFANGTFGGYRRTEAARLLEALGASPTNGSAQSTH